MDRLEFLLQKHINEKLDHQEMREFLMLVDQESDERFIEVWDKINTNSLSTHLNSLSKERVKSEVLATIEQPSSLLKNITKNNWFKIAATIAIVVTLAILLFKYKNFNESQLDIASQLTIHNDIHIQPDSITKININGKEYQVSSDSHDILQDMGIEYSKTDIASINLQNLDNNHINNLTISSPKGHISQIYLPDGSLVWLSSNTSLIIDKSFKTDIRKVRLQGEAYFEVVHNPNKPFYVVIDRGSVKVLGTHFNVSSYQNSKKATVTLVEGSVIVDNGVDHLKLTPNHQAVIQERDKNILSRTIDVDEELSWMNGYYTFNELEIEEVLNTLKQWYSIDSIQYQATSNIQLNGHIRQSKSLRQVLNNIEKISDLKFYIKERRVVVMK